MSGMGVALKIEELPEGLTVSVVEVARVSRFMWIALQVIAACLFLWLAPFPNASFRLLVAAIVTLVFARDLVSALRGTKVVLRVTNRDLISTGYSPGGYNASTVPRADVTNLEYRCASGGGDIPEQPEGLHVERRLFRNWNSGTCVLPLLDQAQAEEVVDRIVRRFPDTGSLTSAPPSRSPLTSLQLKGE